MTRRTLAMLAAVLAVACGGEQSGSTTSSSGGRATVKAIAVADVRPDSGTVPATTVSSSYEDGETAYRGRRYDEAAAIFAAYTERRPDNAWGHYMLGLSSWKSGNLGGAVEAFDRALAIDSTHVKSLVNSARVHLELNQIERALDLVERARTVDSTSSETLRLLGRVRHTGGDSEGAIEAYRDALVRDERDVWAMNNMGLIYLEQGDPAQALPPLARAVELRGNAPVFQNNLGIALERTGHYVAARDAYQAALEVDSTYTKAAVSLERVTPLVTGTEPDSIDLGEVAGHFQVLIRMWQQESAEPADSSVAPAEDACGVCQ